MVTLHKAENQDSELAIRWNILEVHSFLRFKQLTNTMPFIFHDSLKGDKFSGTVCFLQKLMEEEVDFSLAHLFLNVVMLNKNSAHFLLQVKRYSYLCPTSYTSIAWLCKSYISLMNNLHQEDQEYQKSDFDIREGCMLTVFSISYF